MWLKSVVHIHLKADHLSVVIAAKPETLPRELEEPLVT